MIFNVDNRGELDLNDQDLEEIPQDIANRADIVELSLKHNRIRTLPDFLATLVNLRVLHIEDNQIEILPRFLAEMHQLREIFLGEHNLLREIDPEVTRVVFTGGKLLDDESRNSFFKCLHDYSEPIIFPSLGDPIEFLGQILGFLKTANEAHFHPIITTKVDSVVIRFKPWIRDAVNHRSSC